MVFGRIIEKESKVVTSRSSSSVQSRPTEARKPARTSHTRGIDELIGKGTRQMNRTAGRKKRKRKFLHAGGSKAGHGELSRSSERETGVAEERGSARDVVGRRRGSKSG